MWLGRHYKFYLRILICTQYEGQSILFKSNISLFSKHAKLYINSQVKCEHITWEELRHTSLSTSLAEDRIEP